MGLVDLPPHFQWPEPTKTEIILISFLYGWQCGFGFLTARNAWRQTSAMKNPWRSAFAWMVWGEIFINTTIAPLFFLIIIIPGSRVVVSFQTFFLCLVWWTFETQLMLQIIGNRLALVDSVNRARGLRWAVAITWGIFNISVFIVWIPARMQISEKWIHVNEIWDRVEKVAYLIIDLALNVYFIRTVKSKIVDCGLKKYDRLVKFNMRIICVSIACDFVLIAAMSMPSPLVYMEFHTVCYTVKLNIELSLAKLILAIAQEPGIHGVKLPDHENQWYQDVLDPYSIRSFRSGATTVVASQRGTSIGGVPEYKCGSCFAMNTLPASLGDTTGYDLTKLAPIATGVVKGTPDMRRIDCSVSTKASKGAEPLTAEPLTADDSIFRQPWA